jgi:hypothetical protein
MKFPDKPVATRRRCHRQLFIGMHEPVQHIRCWLPTGHTSLWHLALSPSGKNWARWKLKPVRKPKKGVKRVRRKNAAK